MRCGLTVDNKNVVAVVLTEIEACLTYSITNIRSTLEGKWGKMVQKDFLRRGVTDTVIKRRVNDAKRRCFAFYAEFIPPQIMKELQ